jgi:hypothetical protein
MVTKQHTITGNNLCSVVKDSDGFVDIFFRKGVIVMGNPKAYYKLSAIRSGFFRDLMRLLCQAIEVGSEAYDV